ncbi:MAG: ubiquinone/menaquinone biosynthesis C-methylase UbiE [Glaciecola sp.]|jgi:ubiquinone/menaquinone biosynthesis C-methylase UbiE
MGTHNDQERVKNWFDTTYKTKGYRYLRPKSSYKCFITALDIQKGKKFLDVACGPGLMLKVAEENGLKPHGVDITPTGVEMARELVKTAVVQEANAEQLPFENDTFDYITCLGSLERMINLEQVLKEQLRVIAPDGKFCFMVRNSNTLLWNIKRMFKLENHEGHQGAKSLSEWTATFEKAGFHVEDVKKDSWPWIKWVRWMTGGIFLDYYKLRNTPIPLKNTFEFIFIMTKKK